MTANTLDVRRIESEAVTMPWFPDPALRNIVMEREAVSSSMIRSVGYDSVTRTLEIEFIRTSAVSLH